MLTNKEIGNYVGKKVRVEQSGVSCIGTITKGNFTLCNGKEVDNSGYAIVYDEPFYYWGHFNEEDFKSYGLKVTLLDDESTTNTTLNDLVRKQTLVYLKKNQDYGDSVLTTHNRFGGLATLVRMSDKINRIKTLKNRKAEVQESIDDTILDLINYYGIHKSLDTNGTLLEFVHAITEFLTTPEQILVNLQHALGLDILDTDTLEYINTYITHLVNENA